MDNKLQLLCHTDTPASSVESIDAQIELSRGGKLWLRYHVECELETLEAGHPKEASRADGLWQTTCFEVFLARGDDPEYIELNFAPSSQWAAYRFASYRAGMAELALGTAPKIATDAGEAYFALEAEIALPADWHGGELQLAIAAVIEETGGAKSYWALRHPQGKPDFHNRACFTHKQRAASGS